MSTNPVRNMEVAEEGRAPIPLRKNPAGVPYPLSVIQENGYGILVKNDGYDYLALFRRLLRDELPGKTFLNDGGNNFVHLVEADGRAFIYKRLGRKKVKWDGAAWRFLAGPFFSNLMRVTNNAVAGGCEVIPDMYLVAEKIVRRVPKDTYMLLEFVPGTGLDKLGDVTPYKDDIIRALQEIHRHGIALANVKPDHFMVGDDGGMRIIDLSGYGSFLMGRAKDAVKVKRLWNIYLPPASILDVPLRLAASAILNFTRMRRSIKQYFKRRGKR